MVGGTGTGRVTSSPKHGRQRRRRQQVHHHQHVHQHRTLVLNQAAPVQPVEQPRLDVAARPTVPAVPALPLMPTMRDLYYRPTYNPTFAPVYSPTYSPSMTVIRSRCLSVNATQPAPQPARRQDDSIGSLLMGILSAVAIGAAVLGSNSSGGRKRR